MILFTEKKKNYYDVLGIAKNAQTAEIKRAYFGLVRTYQPDRFPEEFKEIRAAYETLSNQEKRDEYDAIGELPSSVAPLFHEAQRFDRFGRSGKAAELYQIILKSHPELDNVREEYAWSLRADDKTGKVVETWEELCRRQPGNSRYARELARSYIDRGWNKKALTEIRRAIALDRNSIDNWTTLITCTFMSIHSQDVWDEAQAASLEALKAVKNIKTEEWKKIQIYTYAFITSGSKKKDSARGHLRELIRLTREGGRKSRENGRRALEEILRFIPTDGLGSFYLELKELADLLPDARDKQLLIELDDIRLSFDAERLVKKGYHEIFHDLFRLLLTDFELEDEETLEIMAIECYLLDKRDRFFPQIRRLKAEFPDLYDLYDSFFNEALRNRDPEKMLFQRLKKLHKLRRKYGIDDAPDEEAVPDQAPIRRDQPKVGRNDPCPCGSGKKYKRCCGA